MCGPCAFIWQSSLYWRLKSNCSSVQTTKQKLNYILKPKLESDEQVKWVALQVSSTQALSGV